MNYGPEQSPRFQREAQHAANRQSVKWTPSVDSHEGDRDFLSEAEVATLLTAAKKRRFGLRDHTMLLLMFRHGFRASEMVALRRGALDLETGRLWVKRIKEGLSTHQPPGGDELRALRAYPMACCGRFSAVLEGR